MFLYWKKRGAYELETLPADLTEQDQATVERFSWSSAMDLTKDLDGKAMRHQKAAGFMDEVTQPSVCPPPLVLNPKLRKHF